MKYLTYYKEENDRVRERFELVTGRIGMIENERTVRQPYRAFFEIMAEELLFMKRLYELSETGEFRKLSVSELKIINERLHGNIRDNYEKSYLNPSYMAEKIGMEYGKYLMWLGVSIRGLAEAALSVKLEPLALYSELFVEIYNLFESEDLSEKSLRDIEYWFWHDCMDILEDYARREWDWNRDFAASIVQQADLSDYRYVYFYGLHISDNEINTAKLLASFSEEKIEAMAKTYTEGYINGFKVLGKDLSKKGSVELVYNIGFERMVKAAIRQLEAVGLKPVIRPNDYCSTPANRQYSYDQRYFDAPLFDKGIVDRKLEVNRLVFEKYKDFITPMAGPAVIEVFGEKPFEPEDKKDNIKYTEKQQKLSIDLSSEYSRLVNQYIDPEDRSFTIIAYPVSDIGDNYKEIFEETIKLNNLDQELYKKIQTDIINALDTGEYVEIKGRNGNRTNLRVALTELSDPEKETKFENCLADVNIPLGEVFTSPKLKGTEGKLHVTQVYLNSLNYIDLDLDFKDGCIESYSCRNFGEDDEANRAYIKENLLHNHDTLPMGEFAIGTNTTAYVMCRKFDIMSVMTILITEKTGPHFAVGDTCYAYEEDMTTFNPDGKTIIAKSNDFADLRDTEPDKAYFNCHTDITIPYSELGSIDVVKKDGSRITLIKDGRFVLPGTEKLNEPLDLWESGGK